jgi:hypothetical protein
MNNKAKSALFASVSLLLISLFAVYFILATSGPVYPEDATPIPGGYGISECGLINGAGTYVLTQDVHSPSGCMQIASGDVILNCDGHSITGYGSTEIVYAYGTADYNWIELSDQVGSSSIDVTAAYPGYDDDDYYGPYGIEFNFPFYAEVETQIYPSSNGLLNFVDDSDDDEYDNEEYQDDYGGIPNNVTPNDFIALYWDDLDHTYNNSIYYYSYETCPVSTGGTGACMVIEYLNYKLHDDSNENSAGTFEAVLYDNGNILLQYKDSGYVNHGNSSTVGIENSDGTEGVYVSYDTAIPDESAVLIERDQVYSGWSSGNGISVSGYENIDLQNCDVSNFANGLQAVSLDNFTVQASNFHNNTNGGYLADVGDSAYPPSISDSHFNDNIADGLIVASGSYINVADNTFNRNLDLATTGLHVDSSSHVNLINGDFIDNSGYGIFDEVSVGSVDWIIEGDAVCRNNDVWISSGSLIPTGGSLTVDNCTITVEGKTLDFNAGEEGYIGFDIDTQSNGTGFANDTIGDPEHGVVLDIYTNTHYTGNLGVTFYGTNPGGSGFYMKELGKYIDITPPGDISGYISYMILKIYYTDAEVSAAGLDENAMRIEYYNESSGLWEKYDTPNGGVNTTGNYVWANLTHFSIYGLFGSAPASGASSSSGGSGGCITNWTCTEWSSCSDGVQTRTCAKLRSACYAGIKPVENQTCTAEKETKPVSSTETDKETLAEQFKEPSTQITLLVTGIVILAIIIYFVMRARRRTEVPNTKHKK